MSVLIASDLLIEHSGHRMRLCGKANSLVAEFDSLAALRSWRRSLPALGTPLPATFRLPGLDGISIQIRVRGRTIALVSTRDFTTSVKVRWLGLLAAVLRLPSRG